MFFFLLSWLLSRVRVPWNVATYPQGSPYPWLGKTGLGDCNRLFTGLSKQIVRHLQSIQNASARILTKTRKYDHISPVLRSLHWLPVAQRIDFKAALLVYKSLHGLALKYISDMIVPYEPSRTLRRSGLGLFKKPSVSTKCGEAAFLFYEANIWNILPEGVRSAFYLHSSFYCKWFCFTD